MPLRYGANVVGVLVLSKLGLDQFDADDLRLLEVLAGHASVAFANARLYEAERREAHGAKALLELSRELSACTELDAVAERIVQGAARILEVPQSVALASRDDDGRPRVPQPVAGRRRSDRMRSRATGCRRALSGSWQARPSRS